MADIPQQNIKLKVEKVKQETKKRTRNPEEWHQQKQKRLRIAGKEHLNTKGVLVPEKKPGPDCHCRRKCFQKVPEAVRQKTFEGFYLMKTHNEQNAYLFGLMRQVDIKRKRIKNSTKRTCTFEYFIRVRGRETQVCQNAFKNIHAITDRKVRVLCKKMDDGVMFPSDNRGKNGGNRVGEVRLPPEILDQVKNHIYSIIHTHRLKDFIRLDKASGTEVNITKMWKDYTKEFDPLNLDHVLYKNKKPEREPEVVDQQIIMTNIEKNNLIPSIDESFVTYPGSGHLINFAENFFAHSITPFQPQQINYIQTTDKLGYYQQTPMVVQPTQQIIHATATVNSMGNGLQNPQQNTFVIMQPVSNPQPAQLTQTIQMTSMKPTSPVNKTKKKGPLVKLWRYTNIFHEEINEAALEAVKIRLNMYFTTKDEDKRKLKSVKLEHTILQQHQQQQQQQPIQIRIVNSEDLLEN